MDEYWYLMGNTGSVALTRKEASKMPKIEGYLSQCELNTGLNIMKNYHELTFKQGHPENLVKYAMRKEGITPEDLQEEDKFVLMRNFTPVPYGKKLMEKYKFKFFRQTLWRWDEVNLIWKADDKEEWLRSHLSKRILGDEQQRKHYIEEVVDYIKRMSYSESVEELPKNLIPFSNIIHDLETDEMIDYTPDLFITSKLAIELDSKYSDYSMIDGFLKDILPEKDVETIYEMMAHSMFRGYPYQKFFIFYGSAKTGKSTVQALIEKFLGRENVCAISPQQLVNNRFSASKLYGKLANISPDIPYNALTDSSMIRQLTGGDLITAEAKYKDSFEFHNHAKLIFSSTPFDTLSAFLSNYTS